MMYDSLGDRMKTYENVTRTYLTRRTPVIIRLDGKAFHSFTRGLEKPFDPILTKTMGETMRSLCEKISGCVLGYTQSDEITLVLCDYKKLTTQAWFDNNIQKICSVSASIATLVFNKFFRQNVEEWRSECYEDMDATCLQYSKFLYNKYREKYDTAMFDSRVFNLPKEEVNNCLIWRQQDAIRNSIQSVAQANFSSHQIEGLSCKQLLAKLQEEKNINWYDLSTYYQRGIGCIKKSLKSGDVDRNYWHLDLKIPIFSECPEYVNSRIIF